MGTPRRHRPAAVETGRKRKSRESIELSSERRIESKSKRRRTSVSLSPERRDDRLHRKSRSSDTQRHRRRSTPRRERSSHDQERQRRRKSRQRSRKNHRSRRSHSSLSRLPRSGVGSLYSEEENNTSSLKTRRTKSKKDKRSSSFHDDSVGHYHGRVGDLILNRYRIVRQVGLGTFGRVLECKDQQFRDRVALKVVRNIQRYTDSARIEADIVRGVNRRGGRGVTHIVRLLGAFTFENHFCLAFECLGPSLYDFMKEHDYQPFPMTCVQDFLIQILEALEFLHSFQLIHTDLKIENILLANGRSVPFGKSGRRIAPQSTRIKLIDFGGSCYDDEHKSRIINTRQYRAPEVIFEMGWSMPSDLWSAGCILVELFQGELLFSTHDNVEHLALIERIIGRFPRHMVERAKEKSDLPKEAFDRECRHKLGAVLGSSSMKYVRRSKKLGEIVRHPEDAWFLNILRHMLDMNPRNRFTAHECLQALRRERRDRPMHL